MKYASQKTFPKNRNFRFKSAKGIQGRKTYAMIDCQLVVLLTQKSDTEVKQNFAAHSDLTVHQIKDIIHRLKALRDIWDLIGYVIDSFRKSTPEI